MTTQSYQRHPLRNFFIKKDLQLRYIVKINIAVIITAAITTAILAGVYYYKSGSGYFYFMSSNLSEDLQRQSILTTVLPSLLIAEIMSVIVGIAIGLFSSRKFAVPIYKIEKWTSSMLEGNITAKISFREKQEFKTLTLNCNALSDYLQNTVSSVEQKLAELEKDADQATRQKIEEIRSILPGAKQG